ncbi:acetylhydrolase [Aestuariicella hydrocarbonica]|uniref:Acetylhydrolase n=1 Tax=Pseudomaricurvus hydrocarbonicus TaxID=1470433 RepID=A0A9E5JTU2_9GAMM|nr:dienelactone hydrolase family protein [Aestuariicella hydrocarbonica]NHO66434.1 acetylhydrolase [Aestuariicella hydrocarbonica]
MRWTQTALGLLSVLAMMSLLGCQKAAVEQESAGLKATDSLYSVGNTTVFIHDKSRAYDSVAGVNTGVRTLITEIWYPADSVEGVRRATYGDYVFGSREAHKRMMTETTFFHLTPETVREGVTAQQMNAAMDELFERERASYVDATPASAGEPFPVVVMTHGDAGSRYNMQGVCELLAAHGYIVIAPEHTGNTPYSMTGEDPALWEEGGDPEFKAEMATVLPLLDEMGMYNHNAQWGQTYAPGKDLMTPAGLQAFDAELLERVNDLRAVIQQLDVMNQGGRFEGKIDLDKLGLMGRSFGGATTLAGLALVDQFKAGMAVVPPVLPDFRGMFPSDMLKPQGVESTILASRGETIFDRLHKPTLLLSGAEDKTIIGIEVMLASALEAPKPTPKQPLPMLYQLFKNSEQPAYWGLLANTNHGSFAESSPYWWPDIKPDTFPRVLTEGEDYTLLDASKAHQIQQQKALQFFDVYVKRDVAETPKLIANPFAADGLEWEVKTR